LQQKFTLPDVFADDYDIPFETSYSYSKVENLIYLFVTIAMAVIGIVSLIQGEFLLSGVLLPGCGLFGFMTYKRMSVSGPVLTLSNEGITTKENGSYRWQDIRNEQIFWVSAGQASYFGLSFEANGEMIKMSLKELTGLRSYKIDHVLRTYRGRYEVRKQK
jgi:hypothetical protein